MSSVTRITLSCGIFRCSSHHLGPPAAAAASTRRPLRSKLSCANQLHQPVLVVTAMGQHTRALLPALDTACNSVEDRGRAPAELFQTHPDYAIIISFPGLADSTGVRVFAEIGDDRARFADARALKAYAGSAPVTRASGRFLTVTHRHIKNNRLADVGWMVAFSAASNCGPARQHYRRWRENGDRHAASPATSSTNSTAVCNTTRHLTRPRHFRCRCATRPSDTAVPNLDDRGSGRQVRQETRHRELRKLTDAYALRRHGRPVCGQGGDYVADNPLTYEHAEMADAIDRDGLHVGLGGHRARARDDDV